MGGIRTSNCREGTLGGLTSFVPVDDVREGDQMRAEMTSLFIGTNDVTPRSVPSLQFEVLPGVTKSTNERSRRSGGHEKKTAENDENKPKLLPKLAGKFKSIQMRKKTCRHILSVDPGFKPWI